MSITASERSALIRVASSLKKGSSDRKTVLKFIKSASRSSEEVRLHPMKGDTATYKNQVREVMQVEGGGTLLVRQTRVGGKTAIGRRMTVEEWSAEPQKWTWTPAN